MLHVIPQEFIVDDQPGIKDPVGMSGVRLEGDVHIVTGAITSAQNIYKSVEKAGLKVADIVLEPLASSYSVLEDDERELGAAVIDMGGGTTDLIVFIEDSVRHTASIGLGGKNVTNDLAIGMFIEHLSKSPAWETSVVFILEDDAQNGPDHVDAHRSPAYIAGGYVKRHYVDHTMYSTSSMIRTIGLILGMSPMTQYDASAASMWRSFSKLPDTTPFGCLPSNVNLNDINPDGTKLAKMSKGLDFSKEDVIPDQIMNDITWKAVKG